MTALEIIAKEKKEKTCKLSLPGMNLDRIPDEVADMDWLKELNMSDNQIQKLKNLPPNLTKLSIYKNKITDISFLEKLTGLQSLYLSYNQISDITPLKNLIIDKGLNISLEWESSGIILERNPLTAPPLEIVSRGREAVVNWFEQMEEGEEPLYETKLMILGQGEAGKTTLAELLLNENYVVKKGKIDSTLGVIIHKGKEYQHKEKVDQKIKAHLWDFGGQDIQKMLHQFFITENCLYVLVSDKRAENARFDYWFQIINLLGPKSSVIVLENPINIESSTEDFPINKYRELYKELTIESIEVNLNPTCK